MATAREKLYQRKENRKIYYVFENEEMGTLHVKAPTPYFIKELGMILGNISANFVELVADFIIANTYELIEGVYKLAYEPADRDVFLEEMNPLFGFVLNTCVASEYVKIANDNVKK